MVLGDDMKRYFLILLLIVFISGCSSSYNLFISDDNFKEEIYTNFEDVVIYDASPGIERDDQVTPFIENDQYPFKNNRDIIYQKNVSDDRKNVELKYNFKPEEFNQASSMNLCFDDVDYKYNKEYFEFNLSGSFYCLYSDEIDINIITNNKVLSNNADSVKGNIYTWKINSNNVDNVSIQIKIKRYEKYQYLFLCVVIFILIGSIIVGYRIFKKRNQERNEF